MEKDKQKKRRPIRRQVQRMVLLLCVAALVLTGILWAGCLLTLRDTVQRDSQDLGGNAAAIGSDALIPAVKADIDAFVGTSPQFDDITMLSLEFKKKMRLSNPDELTVAAVAENISRVTAFVEERLEAMGCPVKVRALISVAVDELFGNIAHYAYDTVTGSATVRVSMEEAPAAACVTFMDHGKPYDPLAKPDPDISLSAEERPIGGLGIFMVKKTMDAVTYEYKG